MKRLPAPTCRNVRRKALALAARSRPTLRMGTITHSSGSVAPGSRFIEVPEANNRVTLRYYSAERRCEQMAGGVPPWTWPELGPNVADLDVLFVKQKTAYEMTLATAQFL